MFLVQIFKTLFGNFWSSLSADLKVGVMIMVIFLQRNGEVGWAFENMTAEEIYSKLSYDWGDLGDDDHLR